jgi:ABC-type multidrug transport system ATPase subunit
MKRKLACAIAFVGDSSILFLDEPSTGLDIIGRTEIWNALKQVKKSRLILLTTTLLEEAEHLSDRIAVLLDGKINVNGTSDQLKEKYGGGFSLGLNLDFHKEIETE